MSKLKAGVIVTPHDEGMSFHRGSDVIAVTERETKFYLKSEADTAIAKLNAENERLKKCEIWMKQHFYCEEVIACESAKKRRLKRALWLARAERASDRARIFYFNDLETMLDIDGFSYDSKKKKGHKKLTARRWRIIWEKVERKCRAMADKF